MGTPHITSPVVYTQLASDGSVQCEFHVNLNVVSTTDPSQDPITSITAYNATTSPWTQIQVTNASTQAVSTFPLPTKGSKTNLTTTDGSGNPVTVSMFTSTVTQAQVNAAGFTTLADIGSYTVF